MANTPSPPVSALTWDQLVALEGNASLLPASLTSYTACSGTTSLQSMLEEEGSPLLKAFFCINKGCRDVNPFKSPVVLTVL